MSDAPKKPNSKRFPRLEQQPQHMPFLGFRNSSSALSLSFNCPSWMPPSTLERLPPLQPKRTFVPNMQSSVWDVSSNDWHGRHSFRKTAASLARHLQVAASCGDSSSICRLLEARASPMRARKDGLVPLHFAVQGGHTAATIALLLDGTLVDAKGPGGITPLHDAAFAGHATISQALLAAQATPGSRADDGSSPLHSASQQGHASVVELLLAHGAQLNVCSQGGFTPLHDAAHQGHAEVTRLLLGASAGLSMSSDGATPLHLAIKAKRQDIVLLLKRQFSSIIREHLGSRPRRTFRESSLQSTE